MTNKSNFTHSLGPLSDSDSVTPTVAAPRDERVSAFGICGKVMLLFKCTVSRQEAGPITGFVLKIDVSKGKLVLLVCEKVEDKQDVPTVQG